MFGEAYWKGRNKIRAAYGAPLLPEQRGHNSSGNEQAVWKGPDEPRQDVVANLRATLQERDAELADRTQVIGELKGCIDQLESRVVELIAASDAMARALLLPKVKTGLVNAFHPDKHPNADEQERGQLTEATAVITTAYAAAEKLQTAE